LHSVIVFFFPYSWQREADKTDLLNHRLKDCTEHSVQLGSAWGTHPAVSTTLLYYKKAQTMSIMLSNADASSSPGKPGSIASADHRMAFNLRHLKENGGQVQYT